MPQDNTPHDDKQYDIFISYRHVIGVHLASRVKDALTKRGFLVFWDDDLDGGKYSPKLLEKIAKAKDILIILTPGCLETCADENDWLRKEIRHAIECEINIVPFMDQGFHMDKDAYSLPSDIASLREFQGVPPEKSKYFEPCINELVSKLLKSKPRTPPLDDRWRSRLYLVVVLAVIVIGSVSIIGYLSWPNKLDVSIAELEHEVQTDPNNIQALSTLVEKYWRSQETGRADDALKKVVNNPEVSGETIKAIANLYNQHQNWTKLEQVLERLVQVNSTNPEAWYDLASIKAMQGKATEVRPALRRALQLNAQRPATEPEARELVEKALREPHLAEILREPDFTNFTSRRVSGQGSR